MSKDIGIGVRKGTVFLPCLVTFWGFHPYMSVHFYRNSLWVRHKAHSKYCKPQSKTAHASARGCVSGVGVTIVTQNGTEQNGVQRQVLASSA